MFNPPPVLSQCIYCGRSDPPLQDEHIIPYGLNGTWTLRDASCKECADITSAFELEVLRNALLAPRLALGFRSRRAKKQPSALPLEIDRGAGSEQLQVPITEHPAVAVLPKYNPPSWITARARTRGIQLIGANTVYFGRIPLADFVAKYRGTKLTGIARYEPVAFARMLAKIAYGYCVGVFGLTSVKNAYVLPAILGTEEDVGTWVGSAEGCHLDLKVGPNERVAHAVGTDLHNGDIVAFVRLFAWAVPDEYMVVVAPAANDHRDEHAQGRSYR